MYTNLRLITSTAQARELGKKGGSVSSPKKRYAARLRELKKKGMTSEHHEWLAAMMEEPESFVLDNLLYLESIKLHCRTVNEKILVARALIDLYKAHHGNRIKTDNFHEVVDYSQFWKEILDNCVIRDRNEKKD